MSEGNKLFRRVSNVFRSGSSTPRATPRDQPAQLAAQPEEGEWVDEPGEGDPQTTARHTTQHTRTQQTHPTHAAQHPSQAQPPQSHAQQPRAQRPQAPMPDYGPALSTESTPGFPDSLIYASDFMLGVGMVILQPSSRKCVLVYDTNEKYWLLPKGRKDVGESLEQAVLREAYEESGYRAQLLPLYIPANCPTPLDQPPAKDMRTTEPFFLSTHRWRKPSGAQDRNATGGEYLTFWYVGYIPENAVWIKGTGVEFEEGYTSHLLTLDEAMWHLQGNGLLQRVLAKAFQLWQTTESRMRADRVEQEQRQASGSSHRA